LLNTRRGGEGEEEDTTMLRVLQLNTSSSAGNQLTTSRTPMIKYNIYIFNMSASTGINKSSTALIYLLKRLTTTTRFEFNSSYEYKAHTVHYIDMFRGFDTKKRKVNPS